MKIKSFHLSIIWEKLKNNNSLVIDFIENKFNDLEKDIVFYIESKIKIIPIKNNDYTISSRVWELSLLWFWEILSAEIHVYILNNLGINWLKAESVKLIERIDYLTAKEITWVRWAQAKLLHYQVLRKELQESWINVVLFDPFKNIKWTLITNKKNKLVSWVEFIWWRNNIVFFSISSWNMYERGILLDITTIAHKYASIDIVSTSETEISFTIDWWLSKKILDEMACKIRQKLEMKEDKYENFVRYSENKALVFCIWQNLSHNIGSLWKAAIALAKWNINIEMVSQWTMERAIIFWIEGSDMSKAVNLLHDEFIK